MTWDEVRKEIVDACHRLEEAALVSGSSGNVSVKLPPADDGRVLLAITPSGVPYRVLKPEQVLVIDLEKHVIEGQGQPSSETNTHIAAYRAREDVGSVIHSHSIYASALAIAGQDIPPLIDEQVVSLGGAVPCAEWGMSGSEQLGTNAMEAMGLKRAVLLRSHGVLGVGADLEEAIHIVTFVERLAKTYIMARLVGEVNTLPANIVELEEKYYRAKNKLPMEG
jgi:L-fuculose-phosphate aldolase